MKPPGAGLRIAIATSRFGTPRHGCAHLKEQLDFEGLAADLYWIADVEGSPGERPVFDGFQTIEPKQAVSILGDYDLVVLNRVPWSDGLDSLHRHASGGHCTLVFDTDDFLFEPEVFAGGPLFPDYPPERQKLLHDLSGRLRQTLVRCSAAICRIHNLASEIERLGVPAVVIPLVASREMVEAADAALNSGLRDESAGKVTIGYAAGHPDHRFNFSLVEGALADVLGRYPQVSLRIAGSIDIPDTVASFGSQVEHVPTMDWRRLPFEFVRWNVGLAPLWDCMFNQGKGDLKFLECGLAGVPVIASPRGEYTGTVAPGENGFLARDEGEWEALLKDLVGHPDTFREIGLRVRRQVLAERTTAACAQRTTTLIRRLARGEITPAHYDG
jgi:hypothetical protein